MIKLEKSKTWFEICELIYSELEESDQSTDRRAKRAALITEVAGILGKSDSLIRRYMTAYDVMMGLMADKTTSDPAVLNSIPFAPIEYVGRIARYDEDRAYSHILALLHGGTGVAEVRADYNEMMALLKEGRTAIIERANGQAPIDRMSKAQFNDFVADAIMPLSGISPEVPDKSVSGSYPELESLMTLQLPDGNRVAVTGYYQMPPVMSFPLEKRFSIWAFAAQFFHQYWIVVHPLSDPEPEVEHILSMAKRYGIGSIGVALSIEAYDFTVVLNPEPDFAPRALP